MFRKCILSYIELSIVWQRIRQLPQIRLKFVQAINPSTVRIELKDWKEIMSDNIPEVNAQRRRRSSNKPTHQAERPVRRDAPPPRPSSSGGGIGMNRPRPVAADSPECRPPAEAHLAVEVLWADWVAV